MKAATKAEKKAARTAHVARMAELHAIAQRIVATGVCPQCGTELIRNLALTGWWQCGALADLPYRQVRFAMLPKCDFQTFTE